MKKIFYPLALFLLILASFITHIYKLSEMKYADDHTDFSMNVLGSLALLYFLFDFGGRFFKAIKESRQQEKLNG